MLQDRTLVPIATKEFDGLPGAEKLAPRDVVFIRVADLAKLNLPQRTKDRVKNLCETTSSLKILQISTALKDSLAGIFAFEQIKHSLLDKWSQAIEKESVKQADQLADALSKTKRLKETDYDRLAEVRRWFNHR